MPEAAEPNCEGYELLSIKIPGGRLFKIAQSVRAPNGQRAALAVSDFKQTAAA
jgi:hypothetical protein